MTSNLKEDFIMPNFYEECGECQFADFIDFDTVKCQKAVVYDPDLKCNEFRGKGQEEVLVGDRPADQSFYEAVESFEKSEAEKDMYKAAKVEHLNTATNGEADRCLYSFEDVVVYNDPEANRFAEERTVPARSLITYKREVYRKGNDLYLLTNSTNSAKKEYINKSTNKLIQAPQGKVKQEPVDIILMEHLEFIKVLTEKPQVTEIKAKYAEETHSHVEVDKGMTTVKIKDTIIPIGSKPKHFLNELPLNIAATEVKIGRLATNSIFYIIPSPYGEIIKFIMLADGTEAILISNPETYDVHQSTLEQTLIFLRIVISVLVIGAIVWTMWESGFILWMGLFSALIVFLIIL